MLLLRASLSLFILTAQSIVPANPAERVRAQIQEISLNPTINNGHNFDSIKALVATCNYSISALPILQRQLLYDDLATRINSITPTYSGIPAYRITIGPNAFAGLRSSILTEIQLARDAVTREVLEQANHAGVRLAAPPPQVPQVVAVLPDVAADEDDRLDPSPVISRLESVNTTHYLTDQYIRHYANPQHQSELDGLPGNFLDNRKDMFELRLINYALAHMRTCYKPKDHMWNLELIKDRLGRLFTIINTGQHQLNMIEQRREKVATVEHLLRALYDNSIDLLPTMVDEVETIMDLKYSRSLVFTRMEAIRDLPSANWEEIVKRYVLDTQPLLMRKATENDTVYWKRVGSYVVDIYKHKAKPYIAPDNLLTELTANKTVQLVPLVLMFPGGVVDASTIFEKLTNQLNRIELEPEVPVDERDNIFSFDVVADDFAAKLTAKDNLFKRRLAQAYQRVDSYIFQTLGILFGTADPIREGLSWEWKWDDFPAERIELCQKVLLTFHYFGRDGKHYLDDMADIAAFAGRATHCADGKKTGIEATSSRALCALSGYEEDIVIEDFDALLKKVVFRDLKSKTLGALVGGHDHRENVTMEAMIRDRNQKFLSVPTNIQPKLNPYAYKESDYGLDTNDKFAAPNTDKVLQHFYQHIYVGPHMLVNEVYDYLNSATTQKRRTFFSFAYAMLARKRPFEDMMMEAYDYTDIVRTRYCAVVEKDDYTFTRKGIEIMLFHAGYLAWDGADEDEKHPLRVDWKANISCLKKENLNVYNEIYK